MLRVATKMRGKKASIYLFSLLSKILYVVPIIAKKLHGRNVNGIFQR